MLKGLVANNIPSLMKGALNEWLTEYNITVPVISEQVMANKSLWSMLPPDYYSNIKKAMIHVHDTEWLDREWLIDAVREEHSAIASLFLSWKKGQNWLDRQLAEIKKQVAEI